MRIWVAWIAGALVAAGLGCDDTPQAPKRVTENAPQATKAENARPSPGDFVNGPRKTIQLSDFPITMEVPATWKIESLGSAGAVKLLQGAIPHGPMPDGVIHVLLQKQPAFSKEAVDRLEASQKKEAQEKPQQVRLLETRPLGTGRLIEEQTVAPAGPGNNPPAMLKWTITVYVESEKDRLTPYALRFIDLTVDAYEKDKQGLQQMVASLKLDAAPAPK